MDRKILQHELDLLLAEWLISGFTERENSINWALSLMERGYQSENLYILAGLDADEGFSIEHYLERLIDDLQLERKNDENELIYIYMSDIAYQVIEGKISPQKGLSIMEAIRIESYHSDFSIDIYQFSDLEEDISLIGEYQLFYDGLTEENTDTVIIQEMKMFLLEKAKNIQHIRNLIYCNKCKSFSQDKYVEKGWIIKNGGWYCKQCDSQKYLCWHKVTDREEILKIAESDENGIYDIYSQ